MPHGTHIVLCFTCGKNYQCGDCITHECPDCERKREQERDPLKQKPKPLTPEESTKLEAALVLLRHDAPELASRVLGNDPTVADDLRAWIKQNDKAD